MKILQICNKIPYPVVDGGTAAMHQLGHGLTMLGHEVKILAIDTPKQNFQKQKLSEVYLKTYKPEYVFLDTSIKPLNAFLNLFSSESYNIKRFDSQILRSKLIKVLQNHKYDIVFLDSLFVTPYIQTIRDHSKSKIILRAHNVEHLVWERIAANEKNSLKKKYLNFLAKRLKEYELHTITKVDGVAAISLSDLDFFRQNFKVQTEYIPFGYNVNSNISTDDFNNNMAYFLGAMNWNPNLEALNWILENIFPELESFKNSFHITVAGNKMPIEFIDKTNENFEVKGMIENPEKFIEQFGILIAPIFSGGGLKIKVVEAMANGKLVITTPIGAEGLGAVENTHYLLCKSKEEFISAIRFCIDNKQKAAQIAQSGQDFIRKKYDLKKIYVTLDIFMKSI